MRNIENLNDIKMTDYKVNSLEEMPKAISYLIGKVENLQQTVNILRSKQKESESPQWMNVDELCAYHPSHPKKQTVYEWVSKKTIPFHKMTKGLMFLKSEIDEWLKGGYQKTEADLMREAQKFILSKKAR